MSIDLPALIIRPAPFAVKQLLSKPLHHTRTHRKYTRLSPSQPARLPADQPTVQRTHPLAHSLPRPLPGDNLPHPSSSARRRAMVDTALQVFRDRQATGHTTVVVFYRGERSFFCRQWLKRWLSIPAIERRFDLADVYLLFVSSQSQGKAYSVADQFTSHASLIDRRVFFYGDPEHLLVNHLIQASISRPVITNPESHRAHGWVFDFGMVQPAIVAVGADCAVLYEWTTKPSLRNVAGKLDRPDPWDVWDRIERRLDRIRIAKARAARKNSPPSMLPTLPAPSRTSHSQHAKDRVASDGVTTASHSHTSELPQNTSPLLLAANVAQHEHLIDVTGLETLPVIESTTKSLQNVRAATFPPITDSLVAAAASALPDQPDAVPVAASSDASTFSMDASADVDQVQQIAVTATADEQSGKATDEPSEWLHLTPATQILDGNRSINTKDFTDAATSADQLLTTTAPEQLQLAIRRLSQTVKDDKHDAGSVAGADKHSHKFIENVSKVTITDTAAHKSESGSKQTANITLRSGVIDSESTVTDSEESAITSALHGSEVCPPGMVMKSDSAALSSPKRTDATAQGVAFEEDEELQPIGEDLAQVCKVSGGDGSGRIEQQLSSESFDIHPSSAADHMDTSVASVGSDQVEISIPISKHESVRTEDSSQANTLNFEHHVLLGQRVSPGESEERRLDMSDYLKDMKDPMKRARSNMMVLDSSEYTDGSTSLTTRASEALTDDGGKGSALDGKMISSGLAGEVLASTVSALDAQISDRISTEEEGNTLKPEAVLIPTTDSPHPEAATPRGPAYDMSPFADAEHELLPSGQLFEGSEVAGGRRDEYEAYDEYIVCEYEVEEYVEEYESDTLSKSRIFKNVTVEEEEDLNGGSTADVSAVVTNALAAAKRSSGVGEGDSDGRNKEEQGVGGDKKTATLGDCDEVEENVRPMGSVRSALRKIGGGGRQKRSGREEREVEEASVDKATRKDTLRSVLRKVPGKSEEGEDVETTEDVECSSKLGRKETLKSVLRKIPVPKNLKRHHTLADSSDTVPVMSTPVESGNHTPLKTPSRHTSLPRSTRGEREVIEIDSGDENGRIVRKDTLRAALRNLSFARHSDVGVESPKFSGLSDCASTEERREGVRVMKRLPGSYDGVLRCVGDETDETCTKATSDEDKGGDIVEHRVERREGLPKSLSDRQADTPAELQITDGVPVKKSKFRRTLSRLRHSALRNSDVGALSGDEEEGERRRRRTRDREDYRVRGGGGGSGREEEGEKVTGKMSFAVVGEKILSKLKHVSGNV